MKLIIHYVTIIIIIFNKFYVFLNKSGSKRNVQLNTNINNIGNSVHICYNCILICNIQAKKKASRYISKR